MIVAERKPLDEIKSFTAGKKKILLVGCRGCVTVCNAGGTKEVEILAALLRLSALKEGCDLQVDEYTLERQCDPEYLEDLSGTIENGYEAVLSMACPIGPQFLSRRYPNQVFFPCLNSSFLGGALAHGIWAEHCQACGNCLIHEFGGLCPISRCAKSLLNGPCGGSSKGACEISPDVECVWQLIVDKLTATGDAQKLADISTMKNWSSGRDRGPRKIIREDLLR
jgi:ferredoxin